MNRRIAGAEGRDRHQPLTLPKVPKKTPTCAFCGRPVPADSHEAFARYRYCSRFCHQAARRTNAAENQKRKRLRPVLAGEVEPAPPTLRCIKCGKGPDEVAFYSDTSRNSGRTNICRPCEKEKFRAYYAKNKARLQAKNRQRNREVRAKNPPFVTPDVPLSPRQLERAIANLTAILDALPETAPALLEASLHQGRINGAVFEDRGGCGCLWGTLGRGFGWSIAEEGDWAKRFRQRFCAEVDLFGRIAPGDTPKTNPVARLIQQVLLTYRTRKGLN